MAGDPQPHAAHASGRDRAAPELSPGQLRQGRAGYGLLFQHEGEGRTLHAHMDRFRDGQALDAQILLTQEPEESIVMCTPFEKPGQFYFNQKINCMRAQGKVTLGDREYVFDPEDSFAVLDWGRGVWTCRSTWYWGSASGMVDGVPFGFNIGYGFGDTSAATENALFYGGKLHKLSQVTFHIPRKNGREHYLAPWTFDSDDRRFRMKFRPILDRAACPSAVWCGPASTRCSAASPAPRCWTTARRSG